MGLIAGVCKRKIGNGRREYSLLLEWRCIALKITEMRDFQSWSMRVGLSG